MKLMPYGMQSMTRAGAGLPQPSGTPFSCHCPCHLPFSPACPQRGPVVHCPWQCHGDGDKVWVAWGRSLEVKYQAKCCALSCSIPGCCHHSCRGSLGCKPHHMHLLQGEIKEIYMCNIIPATKKTPAPSFQVLIGSTGSIPSCIPVCCKHLALSKHSLLHIYVQCLLLLASKSVQTLETEGAPQPLNPALGYLR